MNIPKYAKLELERRYLLDPGILDVLVNGTASQIRDKYLTHTLMRLRSIRLGQDMVFKLCKKYGHLDTLAQPITNIYLSQEEFKVFDMLRGKIVEKLRYSLAGGSLDVYEVAGVKHVVFEVEFASLEEANAYQAPDFVTQEITGLARFRGIDFAV